MNNLGDIEVVKLMVLKAQEKLNASKSNFDNKLYEDSVSRAYYSVFHIISALLFTKGLTFSTHSQVIGNFNKEFIFEGLFPKDFNKKIEKLFRLRQTGDYDIDNKIDIIQAENSIKDAELIYEKCLIYLTNIYNKDKSFWENMNK